MAVTTPQGSPVVGIKYTRVTDTSADWGAVPNSTYFYDKADKLVHYKNGAGVINEIFVPGVSSALLTGLVAGSNTTILATDTVLVAFANLQAQIDYLKANSLQNN